MKKIFSLILRISVTLALLIFLFHRIDFIKIWQTVRSLNPFLFILSFLIYFSLVFMGSWRWQMLLNAAHLRIKKRRVLISILGSQFFNLFLPSTIGGDLSRSFDLFGHTRQGSKVVATVILDRLSGFAGLALLSAIGLVLGFRFFDKNIIMFILILVALIAGIFCFIFSNTFIPNILSFLNNHIKSSIIAKMTNLHSSLSFFKNQKRVLVKNVAVSTLTHLVLAIVFYILTIAMGYKLNLIYFIIFVPIITAISALPVSIGGLGLRDVSSVYLFSKIGLPEGAAFSLSLINFFFMVVVGLIGGIIYVFTHRYRRIQSHQTHLEASGS